MTWTAVFAGVAGLFLTGWRWKLEPFQNRFLAAFAVLFYVVPEMSPLKPFPDFSRYVMPVVPVLIYFAGRLVAHAAAARPTMAAAILAGAVVAWPAYVSIRFVDEIGSDTRSRAAAWLREHNGKAVVEYYAGLAGPGQVQIEWATDLDLAEARAQGVDYIVTSSFTHGRYDFTARWPDLSNDVRTKKERYDQLFALPFEEFVPRYRTFAFSNPVVRIVKLRGAP
jgi:hypothetical protein